MPVGLPLPLTRLPACPAVPLPPQVRAVAEQMSESLRALALVVDKQLPVDK